VLVIISFRRHYKKNTAVNCC